MTVSHSPRPWHIKGNSIYAGAQYPNFDSVAEINTDRPTAQAVANARLIAAAPDLLAACYDLIKLANNQHGADVFLEPEYSAARAAVWRALGWDEESKKQDARLAAISAREEK